MKRLLSSALLILVLSTSACSDKKDDARETPYENSPLVGTWVGATTESWRDDGSENRNDYRIEPLDEGFLFHADGTGAYLDGFPFTYDYHPQTQFISIRESDGDVYIMQVFQLTDTTLQLLTTEGVYNYLETYRKR